MGSLIDDINSMEKNKNECRVGLLLKQLPIKDAEALRKAIDDKSSSLALLEKVLAAHGHIISRKTLLRHRKRGIKETGCICS